VAFAAGKPNPNEDEARKLSMQLRYFEQTAESLQQRLSMINAALTDLTYANMTLESIEKEKENAEMLVPIGGSSYIAVKLADANKVVVGLGAGVSMEKTVPEAKTIVKERLDDLQKTQTSMQQQLTQIAERIQSDRARLESLLSGINAGTQ
jgi:prefoldin alpha subunit